MTETFLLRETQTSGIPKSSGKDGLNLTAGAYRLRFAESLNDLEAAYRLRFLVFNLELGEGLETAYEHGYDTDEFDPVCDHLIVENCRTHQVVGTYRLQTGISAARNLGYYSAREFDFTPYESVRNSHRRTWPRVHTSRASVVSGAFASLEGESPAMQKNARRATSLAVHR